jgi:hypothetical protein
MAIAQTTTTIELDTNIVEKGLTAMEIRGKNTTGGTSKRYPFNASCSLSGKA